MNNINTANTNSNKKYQPTTSSSSNLSLFNVALVKHQKNNKNSDNDTYKLNNNTKNNENIISEKYSDSIIMLKYKLLYSVIKPATNSLSASGKSNGTRLHSTKIHTLKRTNKNIGIATKFNSKTDIIQQL